MSHLPTGGSSSNLEQVPQEQIADSQVVICNITNEENEHDTEPLLCISTIEEHPDTPQNVDRVIEQKDNHENGIQDGLDGTGSDKKSPINENESQDIQETFNAQLRKNESYPELGEDAVLIGAAIGEDVGDDGNNERTIKSFSNQLNELEIPDGTAITKLAIKEPPPGKRLSTVIDVDQLARSQQVVEDVPEVKSFVIALLEIAFEKQTDTSSAAIVTLQKLGSKHPSTVIRTLHSYLCSPESKASTRIRTVILTIIESAITPAIEMGHFDYGLAISVAKLVLDEMLKSSEVVPDIELPSSSCLVSIGAVYCKDVIQLLCNRIQISSFLHPSILKTLGSLAIHNIYGTVPHLRSVLNTLVEILPVVKSSSIRCSFAGALAKFSEALIFYFANMERAPDVSVQREWFSQNIALAFDILCLQWLPCKSALTCQEILEAIGQMSQLLSQERLESSASKLVPSLIQCYRGPVESLYVNRCLALYLDAFFNFGLELAEQNLQDLLQALYQQLTLQPDYSQPSTVKNHYEILRCIERMGHVHLEKVIAFMLLKTEQPGEKFRVAALTAIKHLLNSLKEQLQPYVGAIGAQLKTLTSSDIQSQPNGLKKALVQVIVAMAVQGHLLSSDSIHAGRHIQLLSYLLKLCTLIPGTETNSSSSSGFEAFLHPLNKSTNSGYNVAGSSQTNVTNEELKQMCENVVQLLVSTQKPLEGIFWPLLLSYSLDPEYSRASGIMARALAHLANKKREGSDLPFPSDDITPAKVVARFMVLARTPLPTENSVAVLKFLLHYSASIHPILHQMWAGEIPELIRLLKANAIEQPASLDGWRASLEKLYDATIAQMKILLPNWCRDVANALFEQLNLYDQFPLEKGFLLTLIGMNVYHGTVSQGPSYAVDFIMNSVRHHLPEESMGCAFAMGWCSRSHLDVALLKLQNLERNDYGRRSTGFLGFMKDKTSEAVCDTLKATAARCYTRIAVETPTSELLMKVDKSIVRAVLNILQTSKDTIVRQEGLEAVAAVARALAPDQIQERYVLTGRPDFVKEALTQLKSMQIQEFVKGSDLTADLNKSIEAGRVIIRSLNALAALARLPPTLRADDQSTLVENALGKAIPLLFHVAMLSGEGLAEASLSANQLLASLDSFLLQILRSSLDPGVVDIIFSQLLPWTRNQDGAIRRIALTLLKLTLNTFIKEVDFEPGAPTRFSQGHVMLGKLVPRCTDIDGAVRDLAVDCIGTVLEIISKYLGYSLDYEKPSIEKLESLKLSFGSSDPIIPLTELADLLNCKTQTSDIWPLLESMATALTDPFSTSSSGLSLVMCLILKARGGEIHLRVRDLLDTLLLCLKNVDGHTRNSILNGVCILASHQRDAVAAALLSYSLPHNDDISDCWKALAADPTQATFILDHLTEILLHTPPYEERGAIGNEAIVSFRLLSAISALKSMCQVQQLANALQARFPTLFCVLLLSQSCLLGASPPIHIPTTSGEQPSFTPINREAYRLNPYQMAADAFKSFVLCAQLNSLAEPITEHRHWANAGDVSMFCDLVRSLTAISTVYTPGHLPYIIASLSNALKSSLERHRITAIAFYAELIHQKAGGRDLEGVVRALTAALPDSSPFVRRIALRGLGELGNSDSRQWETLSPTVLNALLDGLEEDHQEVQRGSISTTKEALEGLVRLVPVVPPAEVERLASRLALRVRPFFEHESPQIRQASISLLAQIYRVGSSTPARAYLSEQVHTTLTSLVLHLNESDPEVVQACKTALLESGPLLDLSHENIEQKVISEVLAKHLANTASNVNYVSFIGDLIKIIAANCEEWTSSTYLPAASSYFKSSVPELRANAALFVGLLCGTTKSLNSSPQYRNVCLSITRLLHDPTKSVRFQAMNAISLMFEQ